MNKSCGGNYMITLSFAVVCYDGSLSLLDWYIDPESDTKFRERFHFKAEGVKILFDLLTRSAARTLPPPDQSGDDMQDRVLCHICGNPRDVMGKVHIACPWCQTLLRDDSQIGTLDNPRSGG